MYLKSIEMQGFKAFPDRTVINISEHGITGIVGPNGSGKSNIVDAIRWVLGEQSAKTLRGDRMEDVIFKGTQKRKPLGFCEVSLTMDNSDGALPIEYNEVTVTRRYYRSGESEFYINRKSVRLKDIHELFMDTGLGRDGYSIIGQGRIEEILSLKSTDRREIFEEAAGISKFRYRKEESERRLQHAEDNLVRIRDIITELEAQVGPLKDQAEKAKSFLLLRDELRVLEVSVWLSDLERLKVQAEKAETDYRNADRAFTACQRELEELYEKSNQLTEEMHEKDLQTEQVREEQKAIEDRRSELQADMAVQQNTLQNNESSILSKLQELESEETRGQTLLEQQSARENRLQELARDKETKQRELEALRLQAETALAGAVSLLEQMDALAATAQAQREESNALLLRKTALESGLNEVGQRSETIKSDLEELENRLAEEKAKARTLRQDIEENEDNKTAAENRIRGFELRQQARKRKVEELHAALQETRRSRQAKTDRLTLLRDMEREYEGFSYAVKQVMGAAEKGALRNILGPVSMLIATDDKYSVAIEIALGAAMQNVVVENEESAKAAIAYLKRGNLGRATFLPLTAMRARGGQRDLSREEGFLGWAQDLIRCDRKYETMVSSLVGGTAVCDHIDSAIRLAKQYKYSFRIVTLDGQLITSSGAMTGGSLNKNTGMLSRKNEIERLSAQLTALEKQDREQDAAWQEALRDFNAVEYEISVSREELRRAEDALLQLQSTQTQHAALLENIYARIGELEEEQEGQGSRVQAAQKKIAELDRKAAVCIAQAEELEAEREKLRQDRSGQEETRGQLEARTATLREELAAADAEEQSTRTSLAELKNLIASLAGDRQDKESAVRAIRARNEELRRLIAEQEAQCAEYTAQIEAKQARVRALTQDKLNLEGTRQACEKQSQQKNSDLMNLERERSRLENRRLDAQNQQDSILTKMWENYELVEATAQDVRIELESLTAAGRRITELRSGIKKLGHVNIDAIEEYEKVRERYEFMSAQRDDLEKAKKDLLGVIAELTTNMERIFSEEFRKINESFGRTFVEIFGGGSAKLRLEDDKDILNCGIEIKVELPGKAVQTISLLSGGEKAFVAIALYFAIIKVRATPFCLLDEIDAALDDVNVSKYAEYMRRLCDITQFIAITHRRGTMEGCDILYGVTMQEQGVSKLLALNISEVEKQLDLKPN